MNTLANETASEVFVTVPVYNHAAYIEKCLRSIIEQTYQPIKLLVIDDGSTDGTAEVVARVLQDCPFDAEMISRENRGLCATLNQAVSLSSGKYFAYVGSDDFWLPEFLAARVAMMNKRDEAVICYGHAYLIDDKDEVFDSTANYTSSWGNYPDGNAREMLLNGISPISSTVFYRRSALEKVSWNEASRLEDYELYLQMAQIGDFAFDPQILSVWREHGHNTSKDLQMMVTEVLAAQERNAAALGVNAAELAEIQTRTKFKYAEEFLQHGDKGTAIGLAKSNWRGAGSPSQLAKFMLRMMTPMSVVHARRSLKKSGVKPDGND